MSYLPPEQAQVVTLSTQLEVFISCRNLPSMDVGSPSDPFVVIYRKDEKHNRYEKIGMTEVQDDNPNPDFTKEIKLDYMFEEVQIFRMEVYDCDDKKHLNDLSKHDFIGQAEFVMGDLMTAKGQKLAIKLKDRHGKAVMHKSQQVPIIIRCEEMKNNNDEYRIKLSAKDLPKMDWFGKADPFLQWYRKAEDGGWMAVHKSEVIKNTYKPHWQEMSISVQRLNNGDMKRPILIRCLDWNKKAEPAIIGETETTLAALLETKEMPLFRRDKKGDLKPDHKYGVLIVESQNLKKKYSFLEYVTGGMEINLIVAIDFTGSNGNPKDAKSLHYMGPPNYESQYLKVIRSVGRVLEPYDTDKQINVYGFGAMLERTVSHCFPLTFSESNPQVNGIDGVTAAYIDTLNRVQLYGPTYFHEVVDTAQVLSFHEQSSSSQRYTILLIITDGVINDMQATVDSVVNATQSPLSIIIVGVGTADFKNMNILDADDTPLKSSSGKIMKRDIVQFVPFEQFKNHHISALAKETLAEVPRQVEEYMEMHKIAPCARTLKTQKTLADLYDGPSSLAEGSYEPGQMLKSAAPLKSQPYQANVQQYMQPSSTIPSQSVYTMDSQQLLLQQQQLAEQQRLLQQQQQFLQQQLQRQETQQQILQQQQPQSQSQSQQSTQENAQRHDSYYSTQPINPFYGASAPPQ